VLRCAAVAAFCTLALSGCALYSERLPERSFTIRKATRQPRDYSLDLQKRIFDAHPPWRDPQTSGILVNQDQEGPFVVLRLRDVSSTSRRFEIKVMFAHDRTSEAGGDVVALISGYAYDPQPLVYLRADGAVEALVSEIMNLIVNLEN